MVFIPKQEFFVCEHCGSSVPMLTNGSYRNHCPKCLYSKHVDEAGPGDRLATCLGLMKPVRIDQHAKKGWMIVHQCTMCQKEMRNRAAPDDEIVGFMQRESERIAKGIPPA
ncbi:MAG: RNHCP domain-containing protein [Patescibacteria group bacterium]